MRYNTVAVVYIVIIILIAQAVAPGSYSWRENSISELAAQRYNRAWIVRAGFIGYGLLVAIGAVQRLRAQRSMAYRDLPLLLYGVAMALAGVFSTRHWVAAVAYAPGEANLHSIAATVAGVGISLAMVAYLTSPGPLRKKPLEVAAVVLTLALSALFGVLTRGLGIVQRCLWAVGFVWLVYMEEWRDKCETD